MRIIGPPAALVLLFAGLAAGARAAGPAVPVGLAWGDDGRVRVALRDARAVAVVDPARRVVVGRVSLPFRPASLGPGRDGGFLVGGTDGEVLSLVGDGSTRLLRPATGRGPTRAVPLPGGRVAVASVWEPALVVLSETGAGRSLSLPFPPGSLAALPDGRVVVADAFRGHLALADPESGKVDVQPFDGVNLRGLAVVPGSGEVLVPHLNQYQVVPATATNVDWGLVLSSKLTAVQTDLGKGPPAGSAPPRLRLTLDGSGHGAADPSAVAVSPDGRVIYVALAGADQVVRTERWAASRPPAPGARPPLGSAETLEAVEVGRNPVALAVDPTGDWVVTADAMGDTLTFIRASEFSNAGTVRLGPEKPARTAAQRGEALFLDGRRSMDRWMSCASCHPSGQTVGLAFDTLGDGGYGAAKDTPALGGLADTAPYAWTGRFRAVEDQVRHSLRNSLHGPNPADDQVADLTAFLRTIAPPPPRRRADDPEGSRGATLFVERGCNGCHRGPAYTSAGVKDVGLNDGPGGNRAFNPPSLRGVGWSAPYLHDGRAATLDDLLRLHDPRGGSPLPDPDRAALRSFLETL